jgi:hypothetical protein
VQTFLPYPSFERSARALDRQRLGKQRLEALHLLLILRGQATGHGWRSHPALRMWRGHANALACYGIAICTEWRRRGYRDTLLPRFQQLLDPAEPDDDPPWLGMRRLHASHRSNLLRKDPVFYGKYGWREGPGLPYFWPVEPSPREQAPGSARTGRRRRGGPAADVPFSPPRASRPP